MGLRVRISVGVGAQGWGRGCGYGQVMVCRGRGQMMVGGGRYVRGSVSGLIRIYRRKSDGFG